MGQRQASMDWAGELTTRRKGMFEDAMNEIRGLFHTEKSLLALPFCHYEVED